MPEVSLIVPTLSYASAKVLERAFISWKNALGDVSHEIIVIDAGTFSPEDKQVWRMLKDAGEIKIFPWRFQFFLPDMLNFGAEKATGDNLMFLRSDSILDVEYFQKINQVIENTDYQISVIAPVVHNADGTATYGYYRNENNEVAPMFSAPYGVNKVYAVKYNGMMVPRNDFVELGGFDIKYKKQHFDIDLCRRAYNNDSNVVVYSSLHLDNTKSTMFGEPTYHRLLDYRRYTKKHNSDIVSFDGDGTGKPKLLIVKLLSLGDSVCSIPAMKKLRETYSDHEITLLANKRYASVFKGHDFYDKLKIVEDIDKDRYVRPSAYYDDVACFEVNRFDYDEVIVLNTLEYMAEYKRSGRSLVGHYADLAMVPLSVEEERPEIRWDEEDQKVIDEYWEECGFTEEDKVVAIHLKSGWPLKDWGDKNYYEMIQELAPEGYKFVIVGGEDEKIFENRVYNTEGRFTFNEYAYLFTKCHSFVGPDSGFRHIASAVSCPTVGIFGCANPAVAPSYSKYVVDLLPADGCATPCLTVRCPKFGSTCTQRISPNEVSNAVRVIDAAIAGGEPLRMIIRGNRLVRPVYRDWEWVFEDIQAVQNA